MVVDEAVKKMFVISKNGKNRKHWNLENRINFVEYTKKNHRKRSHDQFFLTSSFKRTYLKLNKMYQKNFMRKCYYI